MFYQLCSYFKKHVLTDFHQNILTGTFGKFYGIILAFFQEFFSGGKIYCYANFFCYANFSIVFGPNFRGAKVSERGKLPRGAPPPPPPPVDESQNLYQRACSVKVWCTKIARILRIVVQTGAKLAA